MKMKAPIIYLPNFCKSSADVFFKQLWNELEWVRRKDVPRREYYVNALGIPYTYGTAPYHRTYAAQPTHPVIEEIRAMVEAALEKELGKKCVMDVCFLNGYEDQSDQLGWHADDSPEMDDDRPIVSVSLGVEREIYFRPNTCSACGVPIPEKHLDTCSVSPGVKTANPNDVEKLKLGNGSMCIMLPGMQDTHHHRIPKANFMCGERISLTFRGYVKPK